jgi:hypothetical protein
MKSSAASARASMRAPPPEFSPLPHAARSGTDPPPIMKVRRESLLIVCSPLWVVLPVSVVAWF